MPQPSNRQVFISYSRKDDIITRRIVAFLRNQGVKVWVDNEKLTPGTPVWEVEIEKAIKNADAIIVVLSPDSKNSEWVRREISLGDQYKKRVFPILISGDQETSISLRLINRQFVDLRVNEDAGLVSLGSALLEYLQELSNQENKVEIESQKQAGKKTRQLTTHKSDEEPKFDKKIKVDAHMASAKTASKPTAQGKNNSLQSDNTAATALNNKNILWFTLCWAIGGLFGGFIYSSFGDEIAGEIAGGAIGGAIGGFVTYFALQIGSVPSKQINIIRFVLTWAVGGAIGWLIGWELTEAVGAGIGMAIFVNIGMAGTLGLDNILSKWKKIAVVTLAWAICGAIGWSIARGLIEGPGVDKSISWAIGTAIGWAIGGFFINWQLMRK